MVQFFAHIVDVKNKFIAANMTTVGGKMYVE